MLVVGQERGERLRLHAHGLVRLVEDGEVERSPGVPCGLRQRAAALVGREHDPTAGALAQERDDVLRFGGRRDAEVVGVADELVAFQLAGGLVATDHQPLRNLAVGEVLPRPVRAGSGG